MMLYRDKLSKQGLIDLVVYSDYSYRNNVIAIGYVICLREVDGEESVLYSEGSIMPDGFAVDRDSKEFKSGLSERFEKLAGKELYEFLSRSFDGLVVRTVTHKADHELAYSKANTERLKSPGFSDTILLRERVKGNQNLAHNVCRNAASIDEVFAYIRENNLSSSFVPSGRSLSKKGSPERAVKRSRSNNKPKQFIGDFESICAAVAVVDASAGSYLIDVVPSLPSFNPECQCLNGAFVWSDSSQGNAYWHIVDRKIFELQKNKN